MNMNKQHFDLLDKTEETIVTFPDGNDERQQQYRLCNEMWEMGVLKKGIKPVNYYGVKAILFCKPFPIDNGI
jgi:hypothetical protein